MFTHACIIRVRRTVIRCKYPSIRMYIHIYTINILYIWKVIFYKAISRTGLRYNVSRDLICIFLLFFIFETERENYQSHNRICVAYEMYACTYTLNPSVHRGRAYKYNFMLEENLFVTRGQSDSSRKLSARISDMLSIFLAILKSRSYANM